MPNSKISQGGPKNPTDLFINFLIQSLPHPPETIISILPVFLCTSPDPVVYFVCRDSARGVLIRTYW